MKKKEKKKKKTFSTLKIENDTTSEDPTKKCLVVFLFISFADVVNFL